MQAILGPVGRLLSLCLVVSAAFAQPREAHVAVTDGKSIVYTVKGDLAITQGDMILGTVAEVEAASQAAKDPSQRSAVFDLNSPPWTAATLYYTLPPGFPNSQRVLDAIEHWNAVTPLKVLPRTGQPNFVQFATDSDPNFCAAAVGMRGGQQPIFLGSDCSTSSIIHEIGHAWGLHHEQSRNDRDAWLTVLFENIDNTAYAQFHPEANSRDHGYYDYGSIMHYSELGFSVDANSTLESVPPGIPIGQRLGLSSGDIDNVSRIYGFTPSQTTITTIPEGLHVIVDGERYLAPRAFDWVPGSGHTIAIDSAPGQGSANTRYNFVRWTDGGAPSHSFTASTNQTVVAAEFQERFRVTTSVVAGSGTVSVEPPSSDGFYTSGTKVRITARPGAGQQFYRWAGTNVQAFGFGLAAEILLIEVRGALNFQAQFSADFMTTIDSNRPGAQIVIDGVTYLAPVKFQSFTSGTSHTLGIDSPQYDFLHTSRLNFNGWEDGSLSTSRTIVIGSAPPTYRANFNKQYSFNYGGTNGGTVAVNPNNGQFYDEGSQVTLSANPRTNQTLQYWLGDVASGDATQNIVIDRSKYVRAVFGPALNFHPTNAASYSSNVAFDEPGTSIAPLEIISLFGSGLGPDTAASGSIDQNGRLSTVVANTRVLFDGVPSPIVYASAGQTSVVVPAEVAGRVFTVIQIERNGVLSGATGTASITKTLPGLFTTNASGTGPVASSNEDGSRNSSTNPAAPGSVVTLYATGAGLTDSPLPNGAVTDNNLVRPQLPVYIRIGTQPAEVLYAGSAPTLVHGVLQVNVRIPADLTSGNHPIKLIVGNNASAPGTTISVR